jgi:hypothetical protein
MEQIKMAKETTRSFNKRAFISVLTGFSFVLMAVTGLVLFFAPSCRIARDTSWAVWGHSKELLAAVHVCFAFAFALTAVFHICLNWTAMKKYFKTRLSKAGAFRIEWVAALAICLAIYVGIVCGAWPFSSLIAWRETYKHGATTQAGHGWRRGRTSAFGDPNCVERDSLAAEGQAAADQRSPQVVQGRSAEQPGHGSGRQGRWQGQLFDPSRRGIGQMTLAEFCRAEAMELDWAIARLRDQGLAARGTMTMREIADDAGVHPRALRDILQTKSPTREAGNPHNQGEPN